MVDSKFVNETKAPSTTRLILFILRTIFCILFLPSIISGACIYLILFLLLKRKPKYILLDSFALAIPTICVALLYNLFTGLPFLNTFCIVGLFITLGYFFGALYSYLKSLEIKRKPYLLQLRGVFKGFRYKKSIFEKLKLQRLAKRLQNGEIGDKDFTPLGLYEPFKNSPTEFEDHIVGMYNTETVRQVFVSGTAGSGKSILLSQMMKKDIDNNKTIVVVDFKKGPDMAYNLSRWAKAKGVPFYHFLNGQIGTYTNKYCKEQASYDPLATGTPTSKSDMILNMRDWDKSSEVYKSRTETIIRLLAYVLATVDQDKNPNIPWHEGGIAMFNASLQPDNLRQLIVSLQEKYQDRPMTKDEENRLKALQQFREILISSKRNIYQEQIEGLQTIFNSMLMSDYSPWLYKGNTKKHIELTQICVKNDKPSVVLFQFNSLEEPEFAARMGNIIMADLSRVAAFKGAEGNKKTVGVYIDEFQSISTGLITSFIEKARSAKMCGVFASQSLNQLVEDGDDTKLNTILSTVSNFIVLAGLYKDEALRISKVIGEYKATQYRTTDNIRGAMFDLELFNHKDVKISTTEESRYKVTPDEFQDLSLPLKDNGYTSEGIYITKACSESICSGERGVVARKFHAIVDKDVLKQPPANFRKNILHPTKLSKIERERKQKQELEAQFVKLEPVIKKKKEIKESIDISQFLPKETEKKQEDNAPKFFDSF